MNLNYYDILDDHMAVLFKGKGFLLRKTQINR